VEPMRAFALIGISGHQHDRDVRMPASGRHRERDAVHHRHFYIGQQQVEIAIVPIECIERCDAIGVAVSS